MLRRVGRAQTAGCRAQIGHIAGRTARELRFRIPPTYVRGHLVERFAWFDLDEMRHRGLREFSKVVVVTQAVATFDVNAGQPAVS